MNQLFGNQGIIPGLPSSSHGAPPMTGFLQDYASVSAGSWDGHDILWTYAPSQANIINSLALQYAVSDRWFCSVPSETNPNRAYSICGTSHGRESNQRWNSDERFPLTTIFNAIGLQQTWAIYYTDEWVGSQPYTAYTFEKIQDARGGEIDHLSRFFTRASAGTLPTFTYLEPTWTSPWKDGTDYHPNSHVSPGEAFLNRVYEAVRTGPQWQNTLLIVTFDEHGGTYDHVPPLWGATPPDSLIGENGFAFNMFGVRVPTILISPFVSPSTVFRAPEEDIPNNKFPFDHTSFIKTLLMWAGVYDSQGGNFGLRVPSAQTFDRVLADHAVNDGNVQFNPPPALDVLRSGKPVHPAGTAHELKALLDGIPVVPARTILELCKTRSAVEAAVENYRADPIQTGAWLLANAGGRGHVSRP
jgi:phospholipase C